MEQELRRVYYDPELGVEACLFQGIDQGFPEHFHTYYVIGTMDRGSREVTIAGETLRLAPGELVFFQPGEPHACRPVGGGASGLAGAPRAAGGHGAGR